MRRLPAALAAIALVALVVPAGAATHGTLVQGTVTAEGGDRATGAYVLVQPAAAPTLEQALNGSRPIVRSLLELADDPPRELQVNRTDDAGNYTVHLPSQGRYQVVAVTEDGEISRLRTVTIRFRQATADLQLDPDRIQRVKGADAAGTPGRTTTVPVTLTNTDDRAVRNLTIGLEKLPTGWSIVGVETAGTYHAGNRTVRFDRVPPGGTATARVTLAVPADAELDTYRIGVTGSADHHYIQHADAVRVKVSPPNSSATPSPTATPLGGDGVDVALSTATPSGSPAGGPLVPLVSVVVFSIGVGVVAFALGRTGIPLLE